MGFLSPLLLVGLGAAALPLLIHLIGRRRARRLPFAALDFLLSSKRRLRRSLRLRELLLLAARIALVVLIALMMARPFLEVPSLLPSTGRLPVDAVLIIDDSASMQHQRAGRSLFTAVRRRAEALVQQLPVGSQLAVVSVTRPEGPLARLEGDRRRVAAVLAASRPTARHATLAPALAVAERLLRGALRPRHVFVLSDMAVHGLPPRVALSPGIVLHSIDVGVKTTAANRAVVALSAAASSAPGHRSMRLEARVCNYAAGAVQTELSLAIDGKTVARGALALPAYGCLDKAFNHTFARAGSHEVSVSLPADQLPLDDRRFLRVDVAADLRVLLVNGDPSPIRHRDELFYLRTALETTLPGQQAIAATVVTAHELARMQPGGFDAVVLANVARVPAAGVAALESFVRGGGGLFIALGDNVRASIYNETLGQLLPQPLRGAVAASPVTGVGAVLRLGRVAAEHPLLAALGGSVGLQQARFSRIYRLRPSTRGGRRVVLHYDDGSPALVEAKLGAGHVLLLTTTIDRDWTDLPIRPGFLPLMQQIVRRLAGAARQSARGGVLVGRRLTFTLPKAAKALRVVEPGGRELLLQRSALGGKPATVTVERPGFYRLQEVSATGELRPLPRESFAANIDAREADLRRGRLPAGPTAAATSSTAKRRIELWHGLGLMLLLLLFGEALLTRRG